jgi:hypothetical protein
MKLRSSVMAGLLSSPGLRHRADSFLLDWRSSLGRVVGFFSVLAAAGLLVTAAISLARDTGGTPMPDNPGPPGSFAWKGFNWEKRDWSGPPQFNEAFDAANVSDPDSNGYVRLAISNPSGTNPSGAEFRSTRRGFGYGTYTTTVEKNINMLQPEVVWGCLYTFDPSASPGYNEIDLCEASAWGGGGRYGQSWPVTQGHGYWMDAGKPSGEGNNKSDFEVADSTILTHKMVWEPHKVTFETYAGDGVTGRRLKRTVLEGPTVPTPRKEAIHFNLWVIGGGGGNPNNVKAETVTLRDFSFTPAVSK